MSEYIQGAYNKYEHDFVERTDEQLQDRLNELHENNRLIGYTGERKAQVEREIALIAFEVAERLREAREQDIDEAWGDYEKA